MWLSGEAFNYRARISWLGRHQAKDWSIHAPSFCPLNSHLGKRNGEAKVKNKVIID
jgi:hypothetical protein